MATPRRAGPAASLARHVVLIAAAALLAAPAAPRAEGLARLEPGGRALCPSLPGWRAIAAALPDESGGFRLVTNATMPGIGLAVTEGIDVFLARFDAALQPIQVGSGALSDPACGGPIFGGIDDQIPAVALPLDGGGLVVAGTEVLHEDGGARHQVFARRFHADGRAIDGAIFVPGPPGADTRFPLLAPDGRDGFLFLWSDLAPPGGQTTGVLRLQRLDAGLAPLWAEPVRISYEDDIAGMLASVEPAGDGGAYVAWPEAMYDAQRNFRGMRGRVQRIGADGTLLWGPAGLRPWDGEHEVITALQIATDGAAGVLVVFSSGLLRAQKLSAAGERLWGAGGIVLADPLDPGFADQADLAAAPDGGVHVAWIERRNGGEDRVLARRLERDGRLPWPRPAALRTHPGPVYAPAQAVLSDGSLAVAWMDGRSRSIEDPDDLYVQVVDRRGRIKGPPGGMAIVTGFDWQLFPAVTPSPAGPSGSLPEFRVVWSDLRGGSLEGEGMAFYAQVVAVRSTPRLDGLPGARLLQGATAEWVLAGDDLQAGLLAEAGEGIGIEASAAPAASPEAPGDSLTLRLRVEPHARPGLRPLVLVNPDGGSLLLPDFVTIDLDGRRVDIDRSGRVDGVDLARLARAFGRLAGDERYTAAADIDADGQVDGRDLALLASRFGSPIAW
jgi:hypothetical protein